MSFYVDATGFAGPGGSARRTMPTPLVVARWLVYFLFGATIFGGLGLMLTAVEEPHPGTPAQTFAEHGLNVRIAGQEFTPQQIKAMDDAWNAKSDADKRAAMNSGKMDDPKSAMDYLGVK